MGKPQALASDCSSFMQTSQYTYFFLIYTGLYVGEQSLIRLTTELMSSERQLTVLQQLVVQTLPIRQAVSAAVEHGGKIAAPSYWYSLAPFPLLPFPQICH